MLCVWIVIKMKCLGKKGKGCLVTVVLLWAAPFLVYHICYICSHDDAQSCEWQLMYVQLVGWVGVV